MSPFQSQLTILQNVIDNWHTLRDNFSDLHAETLEEHITHVKIKKIIANWCELLICQK